MTDRTPAEAVPRDAEEKFRKLVGSIITAQEEDNVRIARELQDDISQRIYAATLAASAAVAMISTDPEQAKVRLQTLLDQLDEVADEALKISRGLYPATLRVLGLKAALEGLREEFAAKSGVSLRTAIPETVVQQLSEHHALGIYRMVQEALDNVSERAANKVEVDLALQDDTMVLRVRDNGVGSDAAASPDRLRLARMRERARLLGGKLSVDSVPGGGTEWTVELPVRGENPRPSPA